MNEDMRQFLLRKTDEELKDVLALSTSLAKSARERASALRRQAKEAANTAEELEKEVSFIEQLLHERKG